MSFKTTYILFGILAVMLAVLGVSLWLGPTGKGDAESYVLPSLHDPKGPVKQGEITSVEIKRFRPLAETFVFNRNPDTEQWEMTQPYAVRTNSAEVTQVVGDLFNARKDPNADVTDDLATWDLKEPAATVILRDKDGREWKVNLGKQTPGKTSAVVYVTSSDQPKEVAAVRKSDVDALFKTLNDFRARDRLLANSTFDIRGVKLQAARKDDVALERAEGDRWVFKQPDYYGEAEYEGVPPLPGPPGVPPPPSSGGVRGLVDAVANFRIDSRGDGDDFLDGVADLGKYGLGEKDDKYLRLEVKRSERVGDKKRESAEVLEVGKAVEAKGGKDKGEERYYARLTGDKRHDRNVFKVTKRSLEPFLKVLGDPAALRDKDLSRLDLAKVDAIDIKYGDGPLLRLRKKLVDWKLYVSDSEEPLDVEKPQVDQLLQAVQGRRKIVEFVDNKAREKELGLDQPDGTGSAVTVWEDGLDKDSSDKVPKLKESAKPRVRLVLGKEDHGDRNRVYLKRKLLGEGEGAKETESVVAVPLTRKLGDPEPALVDLINKGELPFYARKLPPWPTRNPGTEEAEVSFQRGEERFVLVKEKKDDKDAGTWKFKEPASLAGQTVDNSNLQNLIVALQVVKPVDFVRKISADPAQQQKDYADYGLDMPSYVVHVTFRTEQKKEEKKDDKKDEPKDDKKEDKKDEKKEEKKDDKKEEKKEEKVIKEETRSFWFGKRTDDNKLYAMVNKGTDPRFAVFTVDAGDDRFGLARALEGELRDRKVFNFERAKVTRLKLVGWKWLYNNEIETLELVRKSPEDAWTAKDRKDFPVDPTRVNQFLDTLAELRAERFVKGDVKDDYELAGDKARLRLEITLAGADKPLTLTLGKLDGIGRPEARERGYYAQSSSLGKEVFQVSEADVGRVMNGGRAYFRAGN
jgi:hypothetical protein